MPRGKSAWRVEPTSTELYQQREQREDSTISEQADRTDDSGAKPIPHFPAKVPDRNIATVASVSENDISPRLQPNSASQAGMKTPKL